MSVVYSAAWPTCMSLTTPEPAPANSEVDILCKLEYWRAVLHERGLHTEAMVMACAASTIKILRAQVSEKTPKRRA